MAPKSAAMGPGIQHQPKRLHTNHPEELKAQARDMYRDGLKKCLIGRSLDVAESTLRGWLKDLEPAKPRRRASSGKPKAQPPAKRTCRLEKATEPEASNLVIVNKNMYSGCLVRIVPRASSPAPRNQDSNTDHGAYTRLREDKVEDGQQQVAFMRSLGLVSRQELARLLRNSRLRTSLRKRHEPQRLKDYARPLHLLRAK